MFGKLTDSLVGEFVHQKGKAQLTQGNYKEAEKFLRKSIRYSPDNALYNARLGFCLHQQGRDDEAATYLNRAFKLDPEHIEIAELFSDFLMDTQDFAAAIAPLQKLAANDKYKKTENAVAALENAQQSTRGQVHLAGYRTVANPQKPKIV